MVYWVYIHTYIHCTYINRGWETDKLLHNFLFFLLNSLSLSGQSGQFNEDMIPTVGFNMRKVTKGNVTIKLWDIGGQPRFRSMWERYCRGVTAIV